MIQFEESFNTDDVFLRDVTLAFIAQLHNKLKWTNTFHDKQELVKVPFYYSLTGDERFLMDAFIDDTAGTRPELNIDVIPRGNVILTSRTTKTSEFTNPRVPVQVYKEYDGELRKITSMYRVLPIKLTYDLSIWVSTEIDMFKCEQSIWDLFWVYKTFHFEYRYFRIDSSMYIPDSTNTEFPREIAPLAGEDKKLIKFSVDVHTFYPIEPVHAPVYTPNQKVMFKGSAWTLNTMKKKRNWLGRDGIV